MEKKQGKRIFHSIQEFRQYYFPEKYEREQKAAEVRKIIEENGDDRKAE